MTEARCWDKEVIAVKCNRCGRGVSAENSYQYLGETLCEDCYIDIRYPAKACNPWAVYSATRSRESQGLKGAEGLTDLQKAVGILPSLLEKVQEGEYTPEFLKNYILKDLAGPTLQIMKCTTCNARFNVDKPPPIGGYQCPIGGSSHPVVVVDKEASAILKAVIEPKPVQVVYHPVNIVNGPPAPKLKKDSG